MGGGGGEERRNEVALKLGQVYSVSMSPLIDLLTTHNPLQWHLLSVYKAENGGDGAKGQTVATVYFHLSSPHPLPSHPRERERKRETPFFPLLSLSSSKITNTNPDLATVHPQRKRTLCSSSVSLPSCSTTRAGHVSNFRHFQARVSLLLKQHTGNSECLPFDIQMISLCLLRAPLVSRSVFLVYISSIPK